MSLLVTGSIGIDTIETPSGRRPDVIGGSAVYFALGASLLSPVRLVGVVGEDCPPALLEVFKGRDVDTAGLEVRKGSRTFRWHGSYLKDLNMAETIEVDLNVLAERAAAIPAKFLDSQFVFLANTHPVLQQETADRLRKARLTVADTMNLWIQTQRPELEKLLRKIDGLVLNDGEAKLLTEKKNLILAARDILKMGPKFVVIKKGENGSLMVSHNDTIVLPAFPAHEVIDPTGAGDSFAGGMMGYLASQGDWSAIALKRAMAWGTVVASFTIADFSIDGIVKANKQELESRWKQYRDILAF